MGLALSALAPDDPPDDPEGRTCFRDWLRAEKAARATQARQGVKVLAAFVEWLETQRQYGGICHPDMRAWLVKLAQDELPKRRARTDALQREQLRAWFAAVRRTSNPIISTYLQTLLLTGARREELAPLQWADVDFAWSSMTIKDKVEGERVIPLTPYVAVILNALPRRNQWVFSSPKGKTGRIKEPRIAHNRALAAAGLPALSLHGLRRSFGSLSEWVEMPTGVVAQIMGHKPSATAEKHYRRRPLDLLRVWHTKLEGWILAEAGLEQPAPANGERVTPLRAIA